MPALSSTPAINHLIEYLPRIERNRIMKRCDTVELKFGTMLHEADKPIKYVYFPVCGFISLVQSIKGHEPLEMGLIGSEGMLGVSLILGVNAVPIRAVVQGSGSALRMGAAEFRREIRESNSLSDVLKRYLYVQMQQQSQSIACMCFHDVDARLARWLLMTHDRAHADSFHLTHEFLAGMLGVRRSAVSIAAAEMQSNGLISYTRGEIKVLNRSGLEGAACDCYEDLLEDYEQQFS